MADGDAVVPPVDPPEPIKIGKDGLTDTQRALVDDLVANPDKIPGWAERCMVAQAVVAHDAAIFNAMIDASKANAAGNLFRSSSEQAIESMLANREPRGKVRK